MRLGHQYWLPISADMLPNSGRSVSAGGRSGCGPMWQKPQVIPTR